MPGVKIKMIKGTILYVEDNNENRALVRRVLEAGCAGYIQKPIDIDRLAQQVEHHMPKR